LAYEDLRDVVLVGHSMAGTVIAGVAERAPDRLAHLVYLDATVPRDGESDLDSHEELRGDARAAFVARAGPDGLLAPRLRPHLFGVDSAADSAWVNGKLTPHPIKAFTVWGRIRSSAIWSSGAASCEGDARLPAAPRGVRPRSRRRSCRVGRGEPSAA